MPERARKEAWSERPLLDPLPHLEIRRIAAERMMAQRVVLHPGFSMPEHSHEMEQVAVILSGSCIFGVHGEGTDAYEEITVRAGEVLVLPPNCPHNARAEERCEILDVFSPASETSGVDS
jgi:quercetin dioxygenase-like cupin family protein